MKTDRLLVDWKALKALGHPYSRQHTMRLVAQGTFPAPIKLGNFPSARTAWLLKDYLNWLNSRQLASQDVS